MFPYTLQRMVQLMQAQNASVGYHDYVLKDQPVVVRETTRHCEPWQIALPQSGTGTSRLRSTLAGSQRIWAM